MIDTKIAHIVGNGSSRSGLNPVRSARNTVYGCNGYYRHHHHTTFDWLVAMDLEMISEILNSTFPRDKLYVPPYDRQFEPSAANPNRPRNNSGMVAMELAIAQGHSHLRAYGFDSLIRSTAATVSVYQGESCYTRSDDLLTFYNRVCYLDWFIGQHPEITFEFVFPKHVLDHPHYVLDWPNFAYVTVDSWEEYNKCW